MADSRPLSCFRSYTEQPLTLGSTIDGTRSQSRRQSHPSTPPPNHTIHCHNTELNCLLKSISMPNYLCRPAELNSSSPVLPEGAHSLEHNSALSCLKTQNLRGRGRGEERTRWMERGWGGGEQTDRERKREGVREREREEVNTELNYMDIHVHTRIIWHACYLYGYGRGWRN